MIEFWDDKTQEIVDRINRYCADIMGIPPPNSPTAKEWIDFINSDKGQEIMRDMPRRGEKNEKS